MPHYFYLLSPHNNIFNSPIFLSITTMIDFDVDLGFDSLISDSSDSDSDNEDYQERPELDLAREDEQSPSPSPNRISCILDLCSQNNTPRVMRRRMCAYCGIDKGMVLFALQSCYLPSSRRGKYSFYCDECRRQKVINEFERWSMKRKERGDGLLIEHVIWIQMME